jgi:hypothetical protein
LTFSSQLHLTKQQKYIHIRFNNAKANISSTCNLCAQCCLYFWIVHSRLRLGIYISNIAKPMIDQNKMEKKYKPSSTYYIQTEMCKMFTPKIYEINVRKTNRQSRNTINIRNKTHNDGKTHTAQKTTQN